MAKLFHNKFIEIIDDATLRRQLLDIKMIVGIYKKNKTYSTIQPWLDLNEEEFYSFLLGYKMEIDKEIRKRSKMTEKLLNISTSLFTECIKYITKENYKKIYLNLSEKLFTDLYYFENYFYLKFKLDSKDKLNKIEKQIYLKLKDIKVPERFTPLEKYVEQRQKMDYKGMVDYYENINNTIIMKKTKQLKKTRLFKQIYINPYKKHTDKRRKKWKR